MRRILFAVAMLLGTALAAPAQTVQDILQTHADEVAKPSRKSVGVVLDDLVASGLPIVPLFLENWSNKDAWQRKEDGIFFMGAPGPDGLLVLRDLDSDTILQGEKSDYKQLKPNGGVRRVIGSALVQFQLSDPDADSRANALTSISRKPEASQLAPLLASIEGDPDPAIKARKIQLANFLSARFADDPLDRIGAIASLATDTSVEARSVLNQILTVTAGAAKELPDANIARALDPTEAPDVFYAQLV
ncbi:MAG: urea ABC transporter permease subunit UrtB, partial [Litoreibacter sp.]|nr:urea ABC transporter permease subunit UrtB [Litoreibacter sp.]